MLMAKGFEFDRCFTSVQTRAIRTLHLALHEMGLLWLPVAKDWHLNERHYGALQGLNKTETAAKFGEEQVLKWRRAYAVAPEPLPPSDPRRIGDDPRYKHISAADMPLTESLKDTVERVIPFWNDSIAPAILRSRRVLVAAHGNSLRALIKHLDRLSDDAIVALNVPTARPLVYELDAELKPIRHYYLGDAAEIERAVQAVAAQGRAKRG